MKYIQQAKKAINDFAEFWGVAQTHCSDCKVNCNEGRECPLRASQAGKYTLGDPVPMTWFRARVHITENAVLKFTFQAPDEREALRIAANNVLNSAYELNGENFSLFIDKIGRK